MCPLSSWGSTGAKNRAHKNDLKNSPHYVNDPHATVVKKPPEFGGGYSAFHRRAFEGAGTRFLHI